MKRILYLSIAFFAFSACQKEETGTITDVSADVPAVFTASMEDAPATKIHTGEYDGEYRVLWDGYNDVVAMCAGLNASSKYRVKGATANTPVADLYAEKDSDVATDGTAIPDNVAYYPYPNSSKVGDVVVVHNEDGSYTVPGAFSDAQTYLAGSIPSRGFPIVAVSDGLEDHSLNFKNVAGGICFNVKGGAKVKSISFKSNEEDKVIAGNADITVSNTDEETSAPTYEFTGSSKAITLNCDAAVATDVNMSTPFYIGVAPQTFPQGFSVTINDVDGFSCTFTTTKEQVINRSRILNMPEITFPFMEFDLSSPKIGKGTSYDPTTGMVTFTGDSDRYIQFDVNGDISEHPNLSFVIGESNMTLRWQVYLDGESTPIENYCGSPGTSQNYGNKTYPLTDKCSLEQLKKVSHIRISINNDQSGDDFPKIQIKRAFLN